MASGSIWKRVDRIIKGSQYIEENILNKIRIITTYHGPGLDELRKNCDDLQLSDHIVFLSNLNSHQCNYMLKKAHALIAMNDMTNLGNPVLESIFYNIPVISINDDSVRGFLNNNLDSILLNITKDFDRNFSKTIEKFVNNEQFYNNLKSGIIKNNSVKSVQVQQNKEYRKIKSILDLDTNN